MIPDYEGMLEAVYRCALRPGDVAVDIGAHVGRHSLRMAEAVGPKGVVHAFEPLPFAYAILVQVAEQAVTNSPGAAFIATYNLALGEQDGRQNFVYTPDFPEYSGFRERVYHADSLRRETITVEVRRLDLFKEQVARARFIKVDAEGGELTILRGGRAIIEACQPIVSFELGNASLVNYPYTSADYFDFFDDLGYRLFSIFGIALSRDEFVAAADEQFFWDFVAIPRRGDWPFGHEPTRVLLKQLAKSRARHVVPGHGSLAEESPAKAVEAEARVAELLSSTSWRLTAPLRRLSKLLRRK